MNKTKGFIDRHFMTDELPFEARILNFVCLLGAIAGFLAMLSRFIGGVPFYSVISLIAMTVAILCMFLMAVYKIKYVPLLTKVVIFSVILVFWPLHFFTIGGPVSGMSVYFAMIIICSFILLKGASRVIAVIMACCVTLFCYAATLFYGFPVLPEGGLTNYQIFIDIIQSVFIVGFLMGFIILHQARLFQIEKKKAEDARDESTDKEELLMLLNEASAILITAEQDNFEATLSNSMKKIAARLEIDCIYIWRAGLRKDFPVYEKLYSIYTPTSGEIVTLEEVSDSNILNYDPFWDENMRNGNGFVSVPTDKFEGYILEVFKTYGIKTMTAFPVFLHGEYWGFATFDNRHNERVFSDSEAAVLRSSSMLLANAVERNENTRHLSSTRLTMSSMFEANPHMNVLFDSSFNIVDFNPAALDFMGFSTKDEMRAGFIARLTKGIPEHQPDGRASVPLAERFKTTVMEGAVKFETELILDGHKRNLSVEFKRIPYENSFAIVAYVYDITEIHKREIELKAAREQNEAQLKELNTALHAVEAAQLTVSSMFDSNPHINILFDSNFRVVDCNPAAVNYMGFKSKEELLAGFAERLVRSIPEELSSGRKTRQISEWFMEAVKNGSVNLETEFILEGSRRNVIIELKRIPYGDSFAIVGYILDITEMHEREMELKRRDQQLREAVKEAKAANEAKSAFLSTMSHEIRTPMNAILGITEIQLQNEELDADLKEALGKIYASGDMLLGIINDILDLSKIEAGKLELNPHKYEIASLISDTAQLNMMRISSKPIEFLVNIDENTPSTLKGDELRVKQILNNILSNAFKYTASGTVTLTIDAEPCRAEDECVTLIISIKDTGQGMTKEQIAKLFDEYSRFNMEANRETEGTGLGMSITRNLLSLMNGEISVESEPGKGSTFTIRLPQGKIGAEVLGKEMVENLRNFRTSSRTQMKRVQISRDPMPYGSVLIVDDVETNIYVAKGLLSPYKLQIDSANSGFAAIEKIKSGREYDIIFMDHMMPKMDGIEATKIVRGMGYNNPIVALTANAVAGQVDIFLGNGFDDYVSKPIDVRQLNAVLNKLVRDRHPAEAALVAGQKLEIKTENETEPAIDPKFAEIFVRDAGKSMDVLDRIVKNGSYTEEEVRTYVIHVHGMKSALSNVGNVELSAVALKLEMHGRDNSIEIIAAETPDFLDSLREVVKAMSSKMVTEYADEEDEDKPFLRGCLLAIKEACSEYDENTVDGELEKLREKAWSKPVNELISRIAENVLHSEFDAIAEIVTDYLANE